MFNFGENLKSLRLKKNLTQKKIASLVNISEAMICRYEKGEIFPQYDTLLSLSSILNVSLDELCGMQPKGTVSLYGLTDEQSKIVKKLIVTFRTHNNNSKNNPSAEYELLGEIVTEFSRK